MYTFYISHTCFSCFIGNSFCNCRTYTCLSNAFGIKYSGDSSSSENEISQCFRSSNSSFRHYIFGVHQMPKENSGESQNIINLISKIASACRNTSCSLLLLHHPINFRYRICASKNNWIIGHTFTISL